MRLGNDTALLNSIIKSKNDVAFLIGSPVSSSYENIQGVLDVKGVLGLVDDFIKKDNDKIYSDYINKTSNLNNTEKYQEAFSFIAEYYGADYVNELVRKAVMKAHEGTFEGELSDVDALGKLQSNINSWSLPKGTEFLGKIVTQSSKFGSVVLTTNFDPLLSISIGLNNGNCSRTVLHSDGHIFQHRTDGTHIVHLHGHWLDTDTLHTPLQLTYDRPQLKADITSLLKNKTLVVIGYGGWDDVFTQVLLDVMNDDEACIDVIWCFYESEDKEILKNHSQLIAGVEKAIIRNRFRAYKGINCHEHIPALFNKIQKIQSDTIKDASTTQEVETNLFKGEEAELSEWTYHIEKSHFYIRDTEKLAIQESLQHSEFVNLVMDWGLAKHELIQSVVQDDKSWLYGRKLTLIDLDGVTSVDDLHNKIHSTYEMGVQSLVEALADANWLVVFDNIKSDIPEPFKSQLHNELLKLAKLIFEYSGKSKSIFCSRSELNAEVIPHIQVGVLAEHDIKQYINHHSSPFIDTSEHTIDTLANLSEGLPIRLEQAIKDLQYFTLAQIVEGTFLTKDDKGDCQVLISAEMVNRINKLKEHSELHYQTCYELLKVLSVLGYGDTLANLKRSHPNRTIKTDHIRTLAERDLLEAISVKDGIRQNSPQGEKIYVMPAIIRDYIYNQLANSEVEDIVKRVASIHFGEEWKSGQFQLSRSSKELLGKQSKNIGSSQLIIIQLLRVCGAKGATEFQQAFSLCNSYSSLLIDNSRYREALAFFEPVRAVLSNIEFSKDYNWLDLREGKALRMIGRYDEAESLLLPLKNQLDDLNNQQQKSLLMNLAFLYKSKGELRLAKEMAELTLGVHSKNKDAILLLEELADCDISKLKALESKFRNKDSHVSADNAAFKISKLENGLNAKVRWLDKIIANSVSTFNLHRAISKKVALYRELNVEFNPTSREVSLLHSTYIYGFTQKMDHMFNNSHRTLWKLYSKDRNILFLLQIFKKSSLYWRLFESDEIEIFYSNELSKLTSNLLPDKRMTSDYQYAQLRARQISDLN